VGFEEPEPGDIFGPYGDIPVFDDMDVPF